MLQSLAAVQTGHGNAGLGISDEPAAAELCSGGFHRRPAPPSLLSRQIGKRRLRLGHEAIRSEPLDLDPAIHMQR